MRRGVSKSKWLLSVFAKKQPAPSEPEVDNSRNPDDSVLPQRTRLKRLTTARLGRSNLTSSPKSSIPCFRVRRHGLEPDNPSATRWPGSRWRAASGALRILNAITLRDGWSGNAFEQPQYFTHLFLGSLTAKTEANGAHADLGWNLHGIEYRGELDAATVAG